MAAGLELCPKREVVVDLAVEDKPNGLVLIAHGLMTRAREVDDGQSPEAQRQAPLRIHKDAVVVGPPMSHGLVHVLDGLSTRVEFVAAAQDSADAAP